MEKPEEMSRTIWRMLMVGMRGPTRERLCRGEGVESSSMAFFGVDTLVEAREVLNTFRPMCVFVDLRLPDGDGTELVESWPDVPFVVCTGLDDTEAAEHALRNGAQDHLNEDSLSVDTVIRSARYAVARKLYERAQKRLEHQDRLESLGRLSANVAHEINNPIAFVTANLQVLDRHILALRSLGAEPESEQPTDTVTTLTVDEIEELVRDSLIGVQRISGIVRQLAAFSRGPDQDETPELTSLTEIADWACSLTRKEIEQRARLVQELEDGRKRFVGRPGRLAQVATNLLINAAQALPEGERDKHEVRIRTESAPGKVTLIVEDTGRGFSPAAKRRAFEPFFTTKSRSEGTGLGLAIAHGIVAAHNGRLALSDRRGGGARVVVELSVPTGLQIPGGESVHPIPGVEQDRTQLRILVVDDEPAIRRAYSRLLRPHEVVSLDGPSALKLLLDQSEAPFDLILCDLMMTDVDGIEIYERLKEGAPQNLECLVFLTGGAFDERSRSFLESTPVRVLTKPASKDQVLAVARDISREPRSDSH